MKRDWNPVLVREVRQRFRGPRAFVVLTLMLIVLAAVGGTTVASGSIGGSGMGFPSGALAGRRIVMAVLTVQNVILWLIAPALTAASVSGEKEKGTWELLLATPLSGARIIAGKLGSAMAYVALLLFAGLPVLSLGIILGGTSAMQITAMWFKALSTGLFGAMVGLYFSTVARSSARALVSSYMSLVVLGILSICGSGALSLLAGIAYVALDSGNTTVGGIPAIGMTLLGGFRTLFILVITFALFLAAASRVRPRFDVFPRPATV